MDDLQKLNLRMQCLDYAVQACRMTSDSYDVVSRAEEHWKWLTKELPSETASVPAKSTDDIPF